jgi:hypothetical protein
MTDMALSEHGGGGGAARHVWISAERHGLGTAGARHGHDMVCVNCPSEVVYQEAADKTDSCGQP